MKLIGTLSCVFGTVLAISAIATGFLPKFEKYSSNADRRLATTRSTTQTSPPSEIITITERRKYSGISLCGAYGISGYSGDGLKSAEENFRQGNYRAAVEGFDAILKKEPTDVRALLGLGTTQVALHNYSAAIDCLSKVRNECRRARDRKGAANPLRDEFTAKTAIEYSNLDALPEHAVDAIDHEARTNLETAVKAALKPALPDSPSAAKFKNDEHVRILNTSLQLAKKYHEKTQLENLKAMYQLANENTRTLPAELITDCSVKSRDVEKQWQELSRSMLNAAVEQEKKWYLDRLTTLSQPVAESATKRAALNHVLQSDTNEKFWIKDFADAKAIQKEMESQPQKYALLYANVSFDCGVRAFHTRYQFEEAKQFFLLARSVYIKFGTDKDRSATNYNLGLASYELGEIEQAKAYFKIATNESKGKKKLEPNELKAAFNAGILAVESVPTPDDEAFLTRIFNLTDHPEAAVLLGLYYLRQNDFERAYIPFKAAAQPREWSVDSSWMTPYSRSTDMLTVHPPHKDRAFTDDQALLAMCTRKNAIHESIFSRFASITFEAEDGVDRVAFGPDCAYKLTKEQFPSFRTAVRTLYPTILKKTHRTKELAEYQNTAIKTGYYKVRNKAGNHQARERAAERIYTNLIDTTLADLWFTPPHPGTQQIMVRVRVTADGRLEPTMPLEYQVSGLDYGKTYLASLNESIEWAALPPPPPGYIGTELALVFNASEGIGPIAIPGRAMRPDNWSTEW